jgi:mono/diheme cytochrome c family protein
MHHTTRTHRTTLTVLAAASLLLALASGAALAATPAELLAGYTAQAGAPAQAARGQAFFTSKHGKDWTCASCHGAVPTQAGKHASTGKPITTLAPAFNPERFSDPAKVEKWFRRNCNDVADRVCTPAEKADVLAWLISLRP